jgi:hypothetical protein
MLVHKVRGDEFPDLEASVFQEILGPTPAVMPAEGLTTSDHLVIQIKRSF